MIGKVDYAFLQVKMAVKYRDMPAEIVTISYVNWRFKVFTPCLC